MSKDTFNQNRNSSQPALTFEGNYKHAGKSYFQHLEHNLLIKVCQRTQETILKPKQYLMQRDIAGAFKFVSSLYPTKEPGKYIAEIGGIYYTVSMTVDSLNFSKKTK